MRCRRWKGLRWRNQFGEEGVEVDLKIQDRSGITLLNTSDIYGPFTNEILLGKVSFSYTAIYFRSHMFVLEEFGFAICNLVLYKWSHLWF